MRFYTKQHQYYCGIDLHARSMYLCILNQQGEILLHKNMEASPEAFLRVMAPYREDLVVAIECIFTWYWLADLCAREQIAFVLGHALYMKAIHGGKAKNDRIDAHKIAVLLRGGMIPMAYVYPPELRATRDLLISDNYFCRSCCDGPHPGGPPRCLWPPPSLVWLDPSLLCDRRRPGNREFGST
jgi:hypothetical protein